jgi:hypothetical protein
MDRGQCPAPYRIAACGFQILIVYLIDGLAVFGYELKRERVGESGSFICATALIGEERRGGCDYWILVYLRIRQVSIQRVLPYATSKGSEAGDIPYPVCKSRIKRDVNPSN